MLWHLTAFFLYCQMLVVFVLILPIISSRSWNKFFKAGFVQRIATYSVFYFNLFLVMLVAVLIEAVRTAYSQKIAYETLKDHPYDMRPETESLYLMRMFRAQRNLYIAGFSLFIWFVFRRLVRLISEHAQISAIQEATLKQAQSASQAAQRLLNDQDMSSDNIRSDLKKTQDASAKTLEEQIKELADFLKLEKEAHKKVKIDLEMIKKQSLQTNAEYDRVSQECQKLQYRLQVTEGKASDKKSD